MRRDFNVSIYRNNYELTYREIDGYRIERITLEGKVYNRLYIIIDGDEIPSYILGETEHGNRWDCIVRNKYYDIIYDSRLDDGAMFRETGLQEFDEFGNQIDTI